MTRSRPPENVNDRLDWNLLRTFLSIAREGSVSRAAERLHLSQPAVSQALRRLEEQLGLQLIARRGPRIAVTEAGMDVMQIAEEVYGTISRLSLTRADSNRDITGVVRLRIVSGVESSAYDTFLARFHRTYPGIEIECQVVRSFEVFNSLQQKTATLGLAPKRKLPKGIESRLFLHQRYGLFCGLHHSLFKRADLQFGDFVREKVVTFSGDKFGDHMSALTVFRDEHGLLGQVVGSSANVGEVKRLIIAGLGIGFLPENTVQGEISKRILRQLPPYDGVADIDLYMLWSTDQKRSEAESIFLASFHAFLDEQP